MVSELHPLRFELQIWLSRLLWAPKQIHGASSLKFQTGNFAVSYPIHTQKPDIPDLGFFHAFIFESKKINNKHQTKVSAHVIFFPVCEYSSCISNRF